MENKQIQCLVTSHKPPMNSFAMPAREIHHGHSQHSRGAWFGTVLPGAASKASESGLQGYSEGALREMGRCRNRATGREKGSKGEGDRKRKKPMGFTTPGASQGCSPCSCAPTLPGSQLPTLQRAPLQELMH